MNCKTLLVLFAACAVSFSAAAQSAPSLSLRDGPSLGGTTALGSDEATEAALRRALLSQPA